MDYEFRTDLLGRHTAAFPMGHEALGNWLTSELGANVQRIEAVLAALQRIENRQSWEFELEGTEYGLQLSPEEAVVRANSLFVDVDELNDGMDYYDAESVAQCGLDDFKALLLDWIRFVGGAVPNAVA